jgi:hypothetical protein
MLTFLQTAYQKATRAKTLPTETCEEPSMTYSKRPVELMRVDFPPGPVFNIHRLTTTGDLTPINRMGRGALHIRLFNLPFLDKTLRF